MLEASYQSIKTLQLIQFPYIFRGLEEWKDRTEWQWSIGKTDGGSSET